MRLIRRIVVSMLFLLSLGSGLTIAPMAYAEEGVSVLQSFNSTPVADANESFDKVRNQHKILFFMGVALLAAVLITAGLGVAMAILGKEVFVAHMISAGVTVFLSIAHAIVAIVWFFPFK